MAGTEFKVTTSDLQTAISNLTTQNKKLGEKLNDLKSEEQTLSGKWDGDAKEAFKEAFTHDVNEIQEFIQLVDKYIEALKTIADSYRTAETTNKSTASVRNY